MLGPCSAYAIFRGSFAGLSGKNSETDPVPQKDFQSFTFEHAWEHACRLQEGKQLFLELCKELKLTIPLSRNAKFLSHTIANFRARPS